MALARPQSSCCCTRVAMNALSIVSRGRSEQRRRDVEAQRKDEHEQAPGEDARDGEREEHAHERPGRRGAEVAAALVSSGSMRAIVVNSGRTMNGSRTWVIPRSTPVVVWYRSRGWSMRPQPRRVELIRPVSRRITCQAYVRTSRLDQNGTRTAISRRPAQRGGAMRHQVRVRVPDERGTRSPRASAIQNVLPEDAQVGLAPKNRRKLVNGSLPRPAAGR